jgi:hypothetical protein
MSDSDEEAAVLECDMLDDMQWRLRPGFRFPYLMSYDELCQFVNVEARKIGADPFRVKRRRLIQVEGGAIPKTVTFYCNHARAHQDQAGRKRPKSADAARSSRVQEGRHILYSGCSCSFNVIPDLANFLGADALGRNEEEGEEIEGEDGIDSTGQKSTQDSPNLKVQWIIPGAPAPIGVAGRRPGKAMKTLEDAVDGSEDDDSDEPPEQDRADDDDEPSHAEVEAGAAAFNHGAWAQVAAFGLSDYHTPVPDCPLGATNSRSSSDFGHEVPVFLRDFPSGAIIRMKGRNHWPQHAGNTCFTEDGHEVPVFLRDFPSGAIIRMKGRNHWPQHADNTCFTEDERGEKKFDLRRYCTYHPECGRTLTYCTKCMVPLCLAHFESFHTHTAQQFPHVPPQ